MLFLVVFLVAILVVIFETGSFSCEAFLTCSESDKELEEEAAAEEGE